MKRASYREAIRWIAENDDTEFMDKYAEMKDAVIESVTVAIVVDIFDVERARVLADLNRALKKRRS